MNLLFFTGVIIFFRLFIIYFCRFCIYYYVFKTYVSGYIYYIKWELKPLVRLESLSGQISVYGITLVTRSWKRGCLKPTFSDQPISLSLGFAVNLPNVRVKGVIWRITPCKTFWLMRPMLRLTLLIWPLIIRAKQSKCGVERSSFR